MFNEMPSHLMTEDQIERHVERLIDRADQNFLRGRYSSDEVYRGVIDSIDMWAEGKYLQLRAHNATQNKES